MLAVSRLLRPLDYLRIKHAAKRKYDFTIPVFGALALTAGLSALPAPPNIFGPNGFLGAVGSFLGILTGFFIASLAAVSTFNKKGMDDKMPGEPLILFVYEKGEAVPKKISRRQFLCLLFGYLSFLCMFLYLISTISPLLVESAKIILNPTTQIYAKWAFVYFYCVAFLNLLVTTLLGLFYLSDRIHRHDPTLKGGVHPNPDEYASEE